MSLSPRGRCSTQLVSASSAARHPRCVKKTEGKRHTDDGTRPGLLRRVPKIARFPHFASYRSRESPRRIVNYHLYYCGHPATGPFFCAGSTWASQWGVNPYTHVHCPLGHALALACTIQRRDSMNETLSCGTRCCTSWMGAFTKICTGQPCDTGCYLRDSGGVPASKGSQRLDRECGGSSRSRPFDSKFTGFSSCIQVGALSRGERARSRCFGERALSRVPDTQTPIAAVLSMSASKYVQGSAKRPAKLELGDPGIWR